MKKILTLSFALVACICLVNGAEYAISNTPVTPVREEPSHAAEQATQLLFGELCEIVERRSSWAKICSTKDGQIGWVSAKMMTPVSEEVVQLLTESRAANGEGVVAVPMAVAIEIETGEKRMLSIGTRLPNYRKGSFELLGKKYKIDPRGVYRLESGEVNGKKATGEDVVRVARQLLNVSYLWGGKNMMGYDCSGFTQTVYSVFGIDILRNAREQVTQGQVVNSLAEAQPGDLAFFDHADRDPKATNISHVGLLLDNQTIIHCSGKVHIDMIDEQGIHLANGELTHHLVQIRRYL